MGLQVAMLIGIPGSGKSTWAQKLVNELPKNLLYLSSDEIRQLEFGDVTNMAHNDDVFLIMKERMQQALADGASVILDATFVKAEERAPYVRIAREYGAELTAYFLDAALDEALIRNERRNRQVPAAAIRQRFSELEKPKMAEGFDQVITVQDL